VEFKFDLGVFGGVFAVPNAIADEHIKIATANHLKVLLYCLRHSGAALTAGEISRATGVAPDDVPTALDFWRQRIGEAAPTAAPPESSATPAAESPRTQLRAATALLNADYDFSPKEIADVIKNDKDAAYLFERAEDLYGRPLKPNEQKALTVIITEVGIAPAVALALLEYCFTVGKTNASYIKTVAKDWFRQGIDTFEKANSHIKLLQDPQAVKDAKKAEARRSKTKDTATPSSFDLDEYDEIVMAKYKKD
jgi:DnaD/phage-associated family protein